ncbi:MAG: YHS domain-containing (seleno)protein [candidate division KSB1 bacterium]
MKRSITLLASLFLFAHLAFAGDLVNADANSKTGLQGYDPVAFHTVGKATKGNPAIAAEYHGFKYLFASEENKAAFAQQPEKYLPLYGGYCAFGVSIGQLFPVEIDTWEIVNGRLVLQYSQDIKSEFAKSKEANFRKAESNWPKLVKSNSK